MSIKKYGKVFLVGAGPGDPNLLTKKSERLIRNADIILFDRLVNPFILQLARPEIEIINIGKKPYKQHIQQDEINELLIKYAQKHRVIVRLKGGDPAIFGRVQEEVAALTANDIDVEIVPGITSASAAVAKVGIGLTARKVAQTVTFTTASVCDNQTEMLDFKTLLSGGTVAIYMGMKKLGDIMTQIHQKTRINFPVVVCLNVSSYNEQMIFGDIITIVDQLEEKQLSSLPGIILIGMALEKSQKTIMNQKNEVYMVTGPRQRAIERAFELYDEGYYCLISPDDKIVFHESQLTFFEHIRSQLQIKATINVNETMKL